ncbi:MAG: 6,7-dimethyl-8-ribityllumazine synthase [Betaproteobacteria bacterium]|nr:6,7-dimethyl-8-ribityllumazine synthase [Betaproteobacteria bacterium]
MGKYANITELEKNLSGQGLRIGVAMSRFNIDVVEGLFGACREALVKQGVAEGDITLVSVPGALELPLTLKRMALSGRFDALVALGAVVRGDTYHFEVVSNESARGVTEVQLETGIPIANAVLTTDNEEQALNRMSAKGREAAWVALEMCHLLRAL